MADLTLFFLSANDIMFAEQSNDSWYSAHVPSLDTISSGRVNVPGSISVYYRDDPVRVLGCTSQYQFCKANLESNASCTPLTGIVAAQTLVENLWQTERQRALSRWSTTGILYDAIGILEVVHVLGVSSLTARSKRVAGFQARLPNNQWQLEAEHWFTASLADLQRMVVEQATGPIDTNLNRSRSRPQTPEEYLLCGSQVGSSPSFRL